MDGAATTADLKKSSLERKSSADGAIDASDAIFSSLVLWTDSDGDGNAVEAELQGFSYAGFLSLKIVDTSEQQDLGHGNSATETSFAMVHRNNEMRRVRVFSVRLAAEGW
jgi:hypothetical protein